MVLDIAKLLGIHKIGIENTVEAHSFQADGRTVMRPGLAEWPAYTESIAHDGSIAETHETALTVDRMTQNRASFIPHAYNIAVTKTDIFATDSDYHAAYDERERKMLEAIAQHANQGQHVLHLCGAWHLYGLEKRSQELMPNSDILNISAKRSSCLSSTPTDNLSADADHRSKMLLALSAHQSLIKGKVLDIMHAQELAEAAEKTLGNKLTKEFFEKHPEIPLRKNAFPASYRVFLHGRPQKPLDRKDIVKAVSRVGLGYTEC